MKYSGIDGLARSPFRSLTLPETNSAANFGGIHPAKYAFRADAGEDQRLRRCAEMTARQAKTLATWAGREGVCICQTAAKSREERSPVHRHARTDSCAGQKSA
ncbi:MAG TPA: hypothetical protein VFN55_05340, partial [Solirubrobacteraceae bacterium]|nr:hypothetical protein [Solirubrobacteraceae bacterium]